MHSVGLSEGGGEAEAPMVNMDDIEIDEEELILELARELAAGDEGEELYEEHINVDKKETDEDSAAALTRATVDGLMAMPAVKAAIEKRFDEVAGLPEEEVVPQ